MTKKLLIMPYFGDMPEWIDKYEAPIGYDLLIDTNLERFKQRVKDKLGIDCPITYGSPKVWDYRCTFGVLYEEELKNYDFWGHTDFDCVYGDVAKWMTDELLETYDVISNHQTYVCGCWTLYRNKPEVNNLFRKHPYWQDFMTEPHANGWVETGFSNLLETSGIKYKYMFAQGNPWADQFSIKKVDGKLYQDGEEIMMLHFKKTKTWPL